MVDPVIAGGSIQPVDHQARLASERTSGEAAWNKTVAQALSQSDNTSSSPLQDPTAGAAMSARVMASLLQRVDAGELSLARSAVDPSVVAISSQDGQPVAFQSDVEDSSSAWKDRLGT